MNIEPTNTKPCLLHALLPFILISRGNKRKDHWTMKTRKMSWKIGKVKVVGRNEMKWRLKNEGKKERKKFFQVYSKSVDLHIDLGWKVRQMIFNI